MKELIVDRGSAWPGGGVKSWRISPCMKRVAAAAAWLLVVRENMKGKKTIRTRSACEGERRPSNRLKLISRKCAWPPPPRREKKNLDACASSLSSFLPCWLAFLLFN